MAKNVYKKGDNDNRPWGRWEVIDAGEGFCVKRITVNPKHILSLQMHNYRSEHWIIVNGTAKVTNGEDIFELESGKSTFIPMKQKHRIENPYNEVMVFIEIQTGNNLDENDIIRFEDSYGRV
ncbi:MAG: phosphomannose isomerase type II C-terminal cupin domain [Alphaproteobacteria bacterium]